jgi:hypothetical protein
MIRLQERIAALMECGATLDRVERELIHPSGLSADHKSALWLFAWSMADHQTHGSRHHSGLGGGCAWLAGP